jgi:uncharacterized protein
MAYQRRLIDGLLDELMAELPALLLVGPRAAGKTTTAQQRSASAIRLDVPAEAAAFSTDPDAVLRGMREPVLLDEWQALPETLPAVKRAVDANASPGRFLLTGSAYGDIEGITVAGTGRVVRLRLFGMTMREQAGNLDAEPIIDRLARGEGVGAPRKPLDIRDYLSLALRSGFPEAVGLGDRARERWLEGYVAQITTRDASGAAGNRDPVLLRRFLEAYAVNSAGIVEAKAIYDAAGVDKKTAAAYEHLLENVFVVEPLPAWTSNRVKRLTRTPKRYIVDAGVMAAILRLDMDAVLHDGILLGRLLDTFVVSQLRGELEVSASRPRLFHLRDQQGRHEADVIAELSGGRVIAIEIKSNAAVNKNDARHLIWLRDELGDRFVAGVVFHAGPFAFSLGDRITALPISSIWAAS